MQKPVNWTQSPVLGLEKSTLNQTKLDFGNTSTVQPACRQFVIVHILSYMPLVVVGTYIWGTYSKHCDKTVLTLLSYITSPYLVFPLPLLNCPHVSVYEWSYSYWVGPSEPHSCMYQHSLTYHGLQVLLGLTLSELWLYCTVNGRIDTCTISLTISVFGLWYGSQPFYTILHLYIYGHSCIQYGTQP